MSTQETFYCVGILFMIMSPSTIDTSECGVFNFETSNIVNGTLFVKETTLVNLTFTVINTNCSNVTYGDIDIFKMDITQKVYMHQCKVLQKCMDRPEIKNIFCHCLGTGGLYSLTFIADRTHNTQWKWTEKHKEVPDVVITLNVTYPAHVTLLEIEYDTYISNHKTVTVVCTWENGNPQTRAILRDRHNNLLAQSDTSGNISYTFSPAKCLYSGVIRCEADGSVRNKSTTILNPCAPEFVRTATVQTLNIGKNADVTFPFRSHTLNITSCHINQVVQNTNHDTKHNLIQFFICTKSKINESDDISENDFCLYSVSGEPPYLNITIQIRNLKSMDGGLWYVNITNDEGSDVTYLYVKTNMDTDNAVRIISITAGIILGVAASGVIVYYFTKGKDIFAKLGRRENKVPALLKCNGTDTEEYYQRQSETYCEIRDTLENDASDFPFLKPEHLRQVTNEDAFPTTHDHKNSNSSDASTHIDQSKEENSNHSLDWQLVHEGSKTNNVPELSSKRVTTGKETRKIQPMLQNLKIVQIESNINYVP